MSELIKTLEELLHARHSCRGFLPDEVPRETAERIIADAGRAASWCNVQPWHLIVTGRDATERLRSALLSEVETATPQPDLDYPSGYPGSYRDRRRVCGWQLYDAVGVAKGDRAASSAQSMENFRFFGAPHVALLTTERELGPYGALDCGGFILAFMLAAQALGVASIAQAAIAAYAPFLHRHFEIPENRMILCAISFGFEDTAHPANSFRTERAALQEIMEWRD